MAVGEDGSNQIVFANGLQKNFLILFEIQIRKVLRNFARCPLNADMQATHRLVELILLIGQVETTIGGNDFS